MIIPREAVFLLVLDLFGFFDLYGLTDFFFDFDGRTAPFSWSKVMLFYSYALKLLSFRSTRQDAE